MEFRKPYTEIEKNFTPSGEKIVLEHSEHINSKGKRYLKKDREINIYERIQASRESTEIENILRRASEGDTRVLNMVQSNYLDVTGAPSSLAEAQKFVIRAKSEFDKLPKEVRAKFDNNAEIYVAAYGTKEWQDATGITAKIEIEESRKKNEAEFQKNLEKAITNIAEKGIIKNE